MHGGNKKTAHQLKTNDNSISDCFAKKLLPRG